MASHRQNGGRLSVTSLSRHQRDANDADSQPITQPGDITVSHESGGGYINKVFDPVESGIRRISTTVSPEYSRLPKTAEEDPNVDVRGQVEYDDEDLDGDSLDEDVADSEDIEAKYECCGEARLNCTRFTTEMTKEGRKLKTKCSKFDYRGCCRSYFSMETLKRRLPILNWAPKYSLTDLQGDIIAGTTVGLTVLPQAIAFAAIAGLRSEFGLYSSYMSPIIYVFLGTSKDMAAGISALTSLMTYLYATSPVARDETVALLASFFCGFIYVGLAIFGLGSLLDFVSLSVMKAFTVASAITICATQVKRWWGLTGVPSDFLPQLYWTLKKMPDTRLYDFLLGFVCIAIIVFLKKMKEIKWKRKLRELPIHLKIVKKSLFYLGIGRNIVAIVLATIASYIFYVNGLMPFSITGYIPPGVPSWRLPNMTLYDPKTNRTYELADLTSIIGIGFILIPILGILEAMAIGTVFARRFGYRIDVNQELFTYGVCNIFTALSRGFPVCGTFSRTAVNAQSGARTPAGGLITGAIVLLAIQFLTPVFFYIPNASLSCVIILAVVDMMTFQKIWIFWKTRKIDVLPWLITFVLSFCISIAWGVIIGIGFSILLLLYPAARPRIKILKQEAGFLLGCDNVGPDASVMLVKFEAGLMYPAMEHLKNHIIPLYQADQLPKGIIFDFVHVSTADTTTVQGMRMLLENCNKKGIPLVVCNLQKHVNKLFERAKMKFYRKADNVEAAVRLIIDISSLKDKHALAIGSTVNNNNNTYNSVDLQVVNETGVAAEAAASSSAHPDTEKESSTVVDDTVIKRLVREEADRIVRQQQ